MFASIVSVKSGYKTSNNIRSNYAQANKAYMLRKKFGRTNKYFKSEKGSLPGAKESTGFKSNATGSSGPKKNLFRTHGNKISIFSSKKPTENTRISMKGNAIDASSKINTQLAVKVVIVYGNSLL